jgi:hypothetical protein
MQASACVRHSVEMTIAIPCLRGGSAIVLSVPGALVVMFSAGDESVCASNGKLASQIGYSVGGRGGRDRRWQTRCSALLRSALLCRQRVRSRRLQPRICFQKPATSQAQTAQKHLGRKLASAAFAPITIRYVCTNDSRTGSERRHFRSNASSMLERHHDGEGTLGDRHALDSFWRCIA